MNSLQTCSYAYLYTPLEGAPPSLKRADVADGSDTHLKRALLREGAVASPPGDCWQRGEDSVFVTQRVAHFDPSKDPFRALDI